MDHNETPPFIMDCVVIRYEQECFVNTADLLISFCNRQSKTIMSSRSGQDIPKFNEILRGVMEFVVALMEGLQRHSYIVRLWLVARGGAKQNICIEQIS